MAKKIHKLLPQLALLDDLNSQAKDLIDVVCSHRYIVGPLSEQLFSDEIDQITPSASATTPSEVRAFKWMRSSINAAMYDFGDSYSNLCSVMSDQNALISDLLQFSQTNEQNRAEIIAAGLYHQLKSELCCILSQGDPSSFKSVQFNPDKLNSLIKSSSSTELSNAFSLYVTSIVSDVIEVQQNTVGENIALLHSTEPGTFVENALQAGSEPGGLRLFNEFRDFLTSDDQAYTSYIDIFSGLTLSQHSLTKVLSEDFSNLHHDINMSSLVEDQEALISVFKHLYKADNQHREAVELLFDSQNHLLKELQPARSFNDSNYLNELEFA